MADKNKLYHQEFVRCSHLKWHQLIACQKNHDENQKLTPGAPAEDSGALLRISCPSSIDQHNILILHHPAFEHYHDSSREVHCVVPRSGNRGQSE